MAFLDPLHTLQSSVIESLAIQSKLDMKELHKKLASDYKVKVSMPNLYRLVQQLVDHQVLVRVQNRLSLNHVWVSHLNKLSDSLRSSQSKEAVSLRLPEKQGDAVDYQADSLIGLDPIWNHGLLLLAARIRRPVWYVYNSHPWYSLGMLETERRLYEGLVKSGIDCRMLYGHNTALDRFGARLLEVTGFESAIVPISQCPEDGYALWVCADYMVEVLMPPSISSYFAFFFNSIASIEHFDPSLFADVFRMRAKCKITFRRDKREGDKWQKIFSEAWRRR